MEVWDGLEKRNKILIGHEIVMDEVTNAVVKKRLHDRAIAFEVLVRIPDAFNECRRPGLILSAKSETLLDPFASYLLEFFDRIDLGEFDHFHLCEKRSLDGATRDEWKIRFGVDEPQQTGNCVE